MDLLKIYMDKELIEDKPSQTIDQFNEREITPNTPNYTNTFKQNTSILW